MCAFMLDILGIVHKIRDATYTQQAAQSGSPTTKTRQLRRRDDAPSWNVWQTLLLLGCVADDVVDQRDGSLAAVRAVHRGGRPAESGNRGRCVILRSPWRHRCPRWRIRPRCCGYEVWSWSGGSRVLRRLSSIMWASSYFLRWGKRNGSGGRMMLMSSPYVLLSRGLLTRKGFRLHWAGRRHMRGGYRVHASIRVH